MARLQDFEWKPYAEPTVDGMLGWVKFRIAGDKSWWDDERGNETDFDEARAEFKDRVHPRRRSWNKAQGLWAVQLTGQIKDALCDIFDNAAELFEQAGMQLGLFG